ncbi:ankyrin [Parathielavia hyrcaniae]|uniref:Ankyrin n=1 Tax=Parathielavia hyrcaniae TaxID=113614 RepID=A0AAN6Q876_9PEZI|nr:ankyrin [Parathielavia hyrcaniae]
MVEKGAAVKVADNAGWTPILTAAAIGHLEIVEELGAMPSSDPTETDHLGRSALFLSCRYGQAHVVQHLLSTERVDPLVGDWCGSTPRFAAVANGHFHVVELLVAHHTPSLNHTYFDRSLIWWARRSGNLNVAQLLLCHADQSSNSVDSDIPCDVVSFDPISIWCDACTLCIPDGSYHSCKECDFIDLCDHCFHKGVRCQKPGHPMQSKMSK